MSAGIPAGTGTNAPGHPALVHANGTVPDRRTPAALYRRMLRWWTFLLVAAPTAVLAVLGYRRRWICDDGLIYLRPVRQIIAGNGPVFNVGERAESSTGALWQWLLALVTWVTGTDPAFLAVGLGLALSTVGYAVAVWATCRAYGAYRASGAFGGRAGASSAPVGQGGNRVLLVPAGVLVLLAVPPFWSYMTSGLESGLGTCWTGVAWALLVRTGLRVAGMRGDIGAGGADGVARTARSLAAEVRAARAREAERARAPRGTGRGLWGWRGEPLTAFVFGLGWLVRPDLAVASVCFLAVQWRLLRPSRARRPGMAPVPFGRRAELLGAAVALPLAYEVFRAGYYGVLLPLPAIAKEAGASDWARGAGYVQETLGPYWLWPALVVLVVVAVHLMRRAGVRWGARTRRTDYRQGVPAARTRREESATREAATGEAAPVRAAVPALVLAAPAAAGLLMVLYVMRVGGDYMHARMVLPGLLFLLLPVLVVPATRLTAACGGLLLVWLAAAVSPLRHPFDLRGSASTFNVRSSDIGYMHDHNPVRTATWIAHWPRLPHAERMLTRAVLARRPTLLYFDDRRRLHTTTLPSGARYHVVMVGRHLGVTGAAVPLDDYVTDAWGLASPIGAHLALERWSWPGHEKFLRNHWVLADAGLTAPSPQVLRYAGVSRSDVAAAGAALRCGRLAELRHSVRDPLTPGRFWHNLTGAYARTEFRFARAPRAAEAELCGAAGGGRTGTGRGASGGRK
jgi:arabinofuranosyltransferase